MQLHGIFPRRGISVFDRPVSSRSDGLVLWTEAYGDPSIPCQRGAVPGLRVQQEADDEPVRSALKRSGEPRAERGRLGTTAEPLFPGLPLFYPKS